MFWGTGCTPSPHPAIYQPQKLETWGLPPTFGEPCSCTGQCTGQFMMGDCALRRYISADKAWKYYAPTDTRALVRPWSSQKDDLLCPSRLQNSGPVITCIKVCPSCLWFRPGSSN